MPTAVASELGPGEEGEHDGAGAGEEFDPWLVGAEHGGAEENTENPLRAGADNDLGQRGGDAKIDRAEAREEGEREPKGG
jgi:hypothetical protein